MKPYVRESILGPLGKLCEATLELIVPLVVASIIDRGIGGSDKGYTALMVLLLVALGFAGLFFSAFAQYYSAKAAVGFSTGIRHALYTHIQTLSYSDLDALGTSTVITRMTTDASRVQAGLNFSLRLLLRSPFVVFGAMIMAYTINTAAGGVFAITIPLLSIVVFGVLFITMPLYKKVQVGVDKILGRTRGNLSGVRVIRTFGKEESEVDSFVRDNQTLTKKQNSAGHISALMNPLTYVIINLGIIMLIHTGALRVNLGDLTQGEVIALYNYMSQILVELIKLANLIISISRALASASRISDVLAITPTQSYGEHTEGVNSEYAVEINNVCLRYRESPEYALENVSLKVRKGETVGVIGGTGSGKSSLINLIPRFYDATVGEVLIDGREVSEYTVKALTGKIGVVPQKAVLLAGTVRDNLSFGGECSDEDMLRALRIAQAEDFIVEKGGLDARVEAGGKNFSGGQRQRLTIARAIAAKPEILILDDSASALDYVTDTKLREAIKNASEGTTVFIVSQRTSSVRHADKIIVLDDGRAVGIGTHSELLSSCDVYREIYDSQFGREGEYEK